MYSYNKVFLMGYLTREPVLRSSTSGNTYCTAGMAVNRRYRAADGAVREETTFVNLLAHGRQADSMNRYLRKGSPLFVEGRLAQRTWTNRQNEKVVTIEIVVDKLEFLSGHGAEEAAASSVADSPALSMPPLTGVVSRTTARTVAVGGGKAGSYADSSMNADMPGADDTGRDSPPDEDMPF